MNYDALCFGFAFIMVCLFSVAWMGMDVGEIHRHARRPPSRPPGWKNRKGR